MEKVTRKSFVDFVVNKKLALFTTCKDDNLDIRLNHLKTFLDTQEVNKDAFLLVGKNSNAIYRINAENEKSYFYFNSGDEVFRLNHNNYIIYICRSFTNVIYVLEA